MDKNKPLKIKLSNKEDLQLTSDLFVYAEGKGMCQDGAIHLLQLGFTNEPQDIKIHKKDLIKLIKALEGKIPTMNEENNEIFVQEINKIEISGEDD